MSWFGRWFGGGGGLTINDGVYVEIEAMDVQTFVEQGDIAVSVNDTQIAVVVSTDEIQIEVNE